MGDNIIDNDNNGNDDNTVHIGEGILADNAKLVLYWIHGSISSWRVLFLLHEEKVQFQAIRLKIMKKDKDTRQETFLQLNHRGKCPVLIDRTHTYQQREVVLNESLAIIQYYDRVFLNEKYSGFGTEFYPIIIIRVQETNNLLEAYEPMEELFMTVSATSPIANDIIKSYRKIQKELKYWEKYAAQNTYIASPFLSLADIAFFPILDYIDYRGFHISEVEYPNLHRYYHHIRTAHETTRNSSYPTHWHSKFGSQRNLYKRYLHLQEQLHIRQHQKNKHQHRPPREKSHTDYSAPDYAENFEQVSHLLFNNANNTNNNSQNVNNTNDDAQN